MERGMRSGIVSRGRRDVCASVETRTPYLFRFTNNFVRANGHPVFRLKSREPVLFACERFPVFGADIATTGYYGFPLSRDGVVQIANHGPGGEMSVEAAERAI